MNETFQKLPNLKVKPPKAPSPNHKIFKVKKEESEIQMLGGGYYKA